MRTLPPLLICITAVAGIGFGEWLESVPNPLLDGWGQLGDGTPLEHGQHFTLLDLVSYAPFIMAVIGVWKSGLLHRRFASIMFSAIILGGGVVGIAGVLGYPVLWGYGMRLGILPFYIVTAALWLWWTRTGGRRLFFKHTRG